MTDREEMRTIAELEVHKYFDHYLTDVFPMQVAAFVTSHQNSCPWGKKLNRILWTVVGVSLGLGIGGTISVEHLLKVLATP
jgi:hypothetical protein